MRVLMRHGRLEQAAEIALQYLKAWQTQVRKLHLFSTGRQEAPLMLLKLCHTSERINIRASFNWQIGQGVCVPMALLPQAAT